MAPRRLSRNAPSVVGDANQSAVSSSQPSPRESAERNSDFPWDDFDSGWYYDHNYKVLRDDDRQIVEIVRDFFATLDPLSRGNGIDVGSGTNLYPALTMLPFCEKITLYEYSLPNVSWLEREVQCYSSSWDPFWDLLVEEQPYSSIVSPRKMLAAKARVEPGSIFDLPESSWDIGTMFFTAESISPEPAEFKTALGSFIGALRPGAPFSAAFMENSLGYSVDGRYFPAVAVTENDVENGLTGDTKDLEIYRIGLTGSPLRAGYDGMIVATGRVV
ncbi:MAG: SCO2525 family SAM-dependent methyltransferase [Pseudonocardiaceae bacterium]